MVVRGGAGGTPRFRWAAGALLGALGLLLNLLEVPLSPGTDLVFGGVAYLLAAVALGPGPGLLAAAIASVRTIWLWNHPWAWLIFSAEALVVGLLVHRWHRRPLVADALFWLLLGVPLLLLTYGAVMGVGGMTAAVLFLKQPFNGLVNALAAEALLLLPPVRRLLQVRGAPGLRSALAVVVTTAAVIPALVFGIWTGRQEWARGMERARERTQLAAQAYASRLEQYVLLHERAVRSVARGAERRGAFIPEQLQRLVAAEREQFPGFVNIYAADARGVTVAFFPERGAGGRNPVGMDFSDRPYYRALRRSGSTVVSEVFFGRGGAEEPLVVIAEPIELADTLAGLVVGALDLKSLPTPDALLLRRGEQRLRVADRAGTLIFDSRDRYGPGERPRRMADTLAFAAVRRTPSGGVTSYVAAAPAAEAAAVAGRVLAAVVQLPSLRWWVWVEQPMASIQAFVAEAYVRLLALLILVTLLTLPLSTLLANYLAAPLLRLRAAAAGLAAGRLHERVGTLPPAAPAEIHELAHGFDEMADALAGRSEELEELGEITRSLASTLDTPELLRRVIDAALRLVHPDGCGIALLDEERQVLRATEYSIGLLAPAAGQELPLGGSLLGRVVRGLEPLLVAHTDDGDGDALPPHLAAAGSVIVAPLAGRSGVLGVLIAVCSRSGGRHFTPAELHLLQRLARTAAVAVENARLLEAAQAASRAKSDFIATMSHELRTPLNAVLGHLELLQLGIHGELQPAQREALGRIEAASRHLRGLIEEVLSFARLEAGRVELHVTDTDLCALAEEVAAVIQPLAQEKGLRFRTLPCPGVRSLRTDTDKVRQILINLAGNAVKFTEAGEVQIRVEERGGGEVGLAVCDTGPGISAEDRSRLFRPFEQLQGGLSRPHGGTGLGLYLSGQYAALIGGRLEVESEPGRGSTFTLLLPREGPPAPPDAHHA